MKNPECLLQIRGECGGCGVLEIMKKKAKIGTAPSLLKKFVQGYCPPGEQPILPRRPKQSIW